MSAEVIPFPFPASSALALRVWGGVGLGLFLLFPYLHPSMLPRVEGVGLLGGNLLGLADEFIDRGDRLLVGIGAAELGNELRDRRLVHRTDIHILAVFVQQIDI